MICHSTHSHIQIVKANWRLNQVASEEQGAPANDLKWFECNLETSKESIQKHQWSEARARCVELCGFSDACSTLYQEMVCWVGWQTKSNHTIKGSKDRASKLNTEAMRYLHRHRQCFNCLGSQELALHTQILDRIKYIAVGRIASQNQSNIIKPRQSQSLKTAMPSASKLRHAHTHTKLSKLSLALSLIGKACCEWSWGVPE